MSAQAGWYPDPGGGQGLFRYWDGRAWSAATSPDPSAPAPVQNLVEGAVASGAGASASGAGMGGYGAGYGQQGAYGQQAYGQQGSAYANYQQVAEKKRTPWGWWVAGVAVLAAITLVGVLVIRAFTGDGTTTGSPTPGGQGSANACPPVSSASPGSTSPPQPNDGRMHGGPVSVPLLGSPFGRVFGDHRVPFGRNVAQQNYTVESNYDGRGNGWVASVLVAELAAGDGFFTPQQGAKIVVRCVIGTFYGNAEVTSDVKRDEAATIDGREAWLVESQLSFDIPGLQTKGELLLVAIVNAGATSGLYYASIPDTTPELVEPAREALRNLRVDA